jgi:hypothetical protein
MKLRSPYCRDGNLLQRRALRDRQAGLMPESMIFARAWRRDSFDWSRIGIGNKSLSEQEAKMTHLSSVLVNLDKVH